ncbi:hypothetical protein IWX91DRAFT_112558 [Phyllosticta citricarpa]
MIMTCMLRLLGAMLFGSLSDWTRSVVPGMHLQLLWRKKPASLMDQRWIQRALFPPSSHHGICAEVLLPLGCTHYRKGSRGSVRGPMVKGATMKKAAAIVKGAG